MLIYLINYDITSIYHNNTIIDIEYIIQIQHAHFIYTQTHTH